MRRSIVPIAILAPLALCGGLFGCEDGPAQTLMPAPAGAGGTWNNGNTPGFSDPGVDAGFNVPNQGGTKIEICPAEVKHQVWAEMLMKPIIPPTTAAGINMAGLDATGNVDWHGTTVEEAEKINCQSDVYGDLFGDGNLDNTWGDGGEVSFEYRIATRKILQMNLWSGYIGTMDFKCTDNNPDKCPYGMHTYQIQIDTQIKRDGKPFTFDWVGNSGKNFVPQSDELYHALMFTYQPSLPTDPAGTTCKDTGKCIKGAFGDIAYFYIPSLGWAFWVANQNAAQPTPSIPNRLDVFPTKIMGFSFADPVIKLDQEGPRAEGGTLGQAKAPCVLKMGLKYSQFLSTCVQVTGDAAKDKNEQNKLLGGLSHSDERFHFDVHGIDINFTDNHLMPTDIIQDTDLPQADDTSTSFVVDQSTIGKITNDYSYDQQKQMLVRDLHGTGALYKEYARLVRVNLLALAGIADGDTTKCVFPAGWSTDPNFDPATFWANVPAYCTGFEGFITPAPSTGNNDFTNVGVTAALALDNGALKLGMKLGHQKVIFCADANGVDYLACESPNGATGDTFSTSFAVALRVLGKGKLSRLPTEVQDVRFFFKMWVQALVKYIMFEGDSPNPNLDLSDARYQLNTDDLFFDSIGAGQFELAEYVDRRFANVNNSGQDITDFVFEADVKNGIQDAYVFSRDLLRGETAIYTSMIEKQGDWPGQEDTALITNIFGSPILKTAWKDPKDTKKGMYTAYYCATHVDPSNCDMQMPPVDAKGNLLLDDRNRPILAPYPGAFGATAFALGPTKVRVVKTYPLIQQAMIEVPLHVDPYNPKSKGLPVFDILVDWVPKQPGIGFPLALSGTLDKFIMTSQLDLSGTTITANIDYDVVIDPATHMPSKDGSISFLAVETTDFLGDVFLCQDSETKDLLKARMYTPVANILQWLLVHPKAYDTCGIIIRYSPFGNYADYITSLTGGVRLGVTQGGGFGRIVDVTLFVPGQ